MTEQARSPAVAEGCEQVQAHRERARERAYAERERERRGRDEEEGRGNGGEGGPGRRRRRSRRSSGGQSGAAMLTWIESIVKTQAVLLKMLSRRGRRQWGIWALRRDPVRL